MNMDCLPTPFASLMDKSHDGIVLHKGPQILDLNDAAARMFGFPRDELIGRHLHEIHPPEEPDSPSRTSKHIDKLRESGFIRFEQIYHRGDDGRHVVLEITATLLDRKKDIICSFLRDNTKVSSRIAEVENLKRMIYGAPHNIGTWEWLIDKNHIIIDDNLLSLYGANKEEFVPTVEFWMENIHPDDRNSTLALLRKHLEKRTEVYEDRYRFKHWKNEWVWIYASGMIVERDDKGHPLRMVGCHRDITEEMNLAEQQKEQEKRFRLLFEANSSPIVFHDPVFDEQGRFYSVTIADVNKAYEDTLQLRREDIIGKDARDLWPETEQEWFERWGRVATTGQPEHFDMFHTPTGKHYLCSMFRIDDKTGRFCVSFQDMTQRIRAEEALRAKEEQLRQSQKMEAIGQLAGGIAHDFNNMLAGILGYAELIEESQKNSTETCDYCEQIINTCQKAGELTRQLLAFARKGQYISTTVNLHATIQNAIDLLARTIDRNIDIETDFTEDSISVIGDPSQLQSMFLNLGINARDAMPRGGKLLVSTRLYELAEEESRGIPFEIQPGLFVKITIKDTGIGIKEENLERIFEPFFTTKEIGKGTGLGLAAVYGTVTSHKGAITVSSNLDRGTHFTVLLPASPETAIAATSPPALPAHSGTILLVDDEPVIRSMGEALLTKQGFNVILAENGLDGLGLYELRKDDIDVVILDVVMPRLGGIETLEKLKQLDSEVKVIMSSGFADDSRIREFSKMGIEGFVKKPFTRADLINAISQALSPRDSRQPRATESTSQ